ncbi:MAG: hypothetical protein M1133_04055 [Armatimonadetes bacterium]|nr:hypothetical protein [Armatimonadota bacterium]
MALSNAMNMLTESFLEAYDNRIAEVAGICSDTAQTLSEFHAAHQRMATEQRRKLSEQIDSLRSTVASTLNTLDESHHKMAAELRDKLNNERERLLSDVSTMRNDLQVDHGKARKAWTDFNTQMRRRRAKGLGVATKKAAASHATASAPHATTKPKMAHDDLTTIAGIGANRMQCLNGMGIFTFAQLATSTPQKIRNAFGASGRLANVEQWIKDARKFKSN